MYGVINELVSAKNRGLRNRSWPKRTHLAGHIHTLTIYGRTPPPPGRESAFVAYILVPQYWSDHG